MNTPVKEGTSFFKSLKQPFKKLINKQEQGETLSLALLVVIIPDLDKAIH